MALLNKGYWPLWAHTRNRKAIAAGDKIAVYLSGDGGSQIIATAKVHAIAAWNRAFAKDYPLTLDGEAISVLLLDEVHVLPAPICVKDRLRDISFINAASSKWGVCFMGGTRAVTPADFAVLTRSS